MNQKYRDFGSWMQQLFHCKVQKLAVNAGFTCPNRDGLLSKGGCIYCNNRSFNPAYCVDGIGVRQQLEAGKQFFARKYPEMKYLAYFQTFTNTYAPLSRLKALYEEALSVPDVVGLVIGTRPDCVPDEVMQYLGELARRTFVLLELGVESCNDHTLRLINRGHTFACSADAIERAHRAGLYTGVHIILGLPGEDAAESLRQARVLSQLPIDVLKLHQLQVIRDTPLERMYREKPFKLYTVEEYLDLVAQYIKVMRPDMIYDRFTSQSPAELLVAPRWGLKNYEFVNLLEKRL